MQIALAVITALGSLIGLIAYVVKRRDDRKAEKIKEAVQAGDNLNEALKTNDSSKINSAINDLNNL